MEGRCESMSLLSEEVEFDRSYHRKRRNGISNLIQFELKPFTFITSSR